MNLEDKILEKNKIVSITLIVLYYLCLFYYYLFVPYCDALVSVSKLAFVIIIIILPLFLILFPIILKFILKRKNTFVLINSYICLTIYVFLTLIIGFLSDGFIEKFTKEKWNNSNYCIVRFMMIDDIERNYSFIGMNKNEVYDIFGKSDENVCPYDFSNENKICYEVYSSEFKNDFYCLYFDENGNVIDTEYIINS